MQRRKTSLFAQTHLALIKFFNNNNGVMCTLNFFLSFLPLSVYPFIPLLFLTGSVALTSLCTKIAPITSPTFFRSACTNAYKNCVSAAYLRIQMEYGLICPSYATLNFSVSFCLIWRSFALFFLFFFALRRCSGTLASFVCWKPYELPVRRRKFLLAIRVHCRERQCTAR